MAPSPALLPGNSNAEQKLSPIRLHGSRLMHQHQIGKGQNLAGEDVQVLECVSQRRKRFLFSEQYHHAPSRSFPLLSTGESVTLRQGSGQPALEGRCLQDVPKDRIIVKLHCGSKPHLLLPRFPGSQKIRALDTHTHCPFNTLLFLNPLVLKIRFIANRFEQ